MTVGFSETSTVQAAVVERLVGLGWEYVSGNQLDRTSDAVMVASDVVSALKRLNPLIAEQPGRVDDVLPKLRAGLLTADMEGLVAANEAMTTWLRGHKSVRYQGLPAEQYEPVRLIDFEDPSANRLVVSDEVTFGPVGAQRRFDVVLWVNGIPLVVGETKTAVDSSVSWLNAAKDVHDVYEVEAAPFFAPNVLSFATEGWALHYGAVRQPTAEWLPWGSTGDPYDLDGWPRVKRSIDLLLSPDALLRALRSYVLFDRPVVDGTPQHQKLLARYPQVEGVEAIHARVLSDRKKGLIWHHQGTGKTLLQAFAALRLLSDDEVGGPTVVLVMDRLDLVEDVLRQFRTAGLPRMTEARTSSELRRLLLDDRRGILVTTIFRYKNAGLLNERENVIVLVDEAHRTQEGSLGQDMRTALPKAQFFGLTGSPISDADRNTFRLFGDKDDPGWVLNHYSMERSIADGSSVPIHVESRLVKYHLDDEALDEAFAAMADEEGLTEEERDILASKASRAKTLQAAPDVVSEVCADIVEHYYRKVEPLGMKAQVVALDREMCTFYEAEIARLVAERGKAHEVAVVMTVGTSKSEPAEWREKYHLERHEEEKVRNSFRDAGNPLKFLVVTAKLLTGFNAPVEGVMYLARPLRLHTLFQAITRTNRRWTNPATGQEKRYGLIVDYVGIGDEIAKAIRAADPDRPAKRPVDIEGLLEELDDALDTALERFDGIDRADRSMDTLQEALERIPRGDARDAFARDFLVVQGLWEFVDPHPSLTDRKTDYRWLAQLYESSKPSTVSDALLWQRLGAKTLQLVHGHLSQVKVTGTGLDEVVVDEEAIDAIRQLALPGTDTSGSDPDGAITAGEALDTIEARLRKRLAKRDHPVYRSLSERLEKLRRSQIDKASASTEFLRELLELARQVTEAEKADDDGLLDEHLLPDPHIGALTQIFEEFRPDGTPVLVEEVVRDIDEIVRQVRYSGWNESHEGDRTVRREVRLVLKRYGLPTTGELFERAYGYISENY